MGLLHKRDPSTRGCCGRQAAGGGAARAGRGRNQEQNPKDEVEVIKELRRCRCRWLWTAVTRPNAPDPYKHLGDGEFHGPCVSPQLKKKN